MKNIPLTGTVLVLICLFAGCVSSLTPEERASMTADELLNHWKSWHLAGRVGDKEYRDQLYEEMAAKYGWPDSIRDDVLAYRVTRGMTYNQVIATMRTWPDSKSVWSDGDAVWNYRYPWAVQNGEHHDHVDIVFRRNRVVDVHIFDF